MLVDTNIWLAAADRRSDRHAQCAALLRSRRGELAAPVPVIAEASWLILDRLGTAAQASYLRLITSGQLTPVDLTAADWQRCLDLAEQYASLRLDLIDASLIAVAERLKLTTLATLNHRDFTVVRPRHAAAFELLP
ncbi:MAG TPA: PIN domain-containing protein [Streptosporangiaceae bacterium]|nr:PIN domain-containing protein [Streptosporangiaceae bacterium]